MEITIADGLGLLGVGLVVVTYGLSQTGRMENHTPLYPGLNAIGAVLILYSLYFRPNPASIVIEVFWLLISLVGLVRALAARRREAGAAAPGGND